MKYSDVVIVGSGHAGAQTACALRQARYEGSIAIVSRDIQLPYERPPLSKEFLSGEKAFEKILLRPPAFWSDRQIELLLGEVVVNIDPAHKVARLERGTAIQYSFLVWAAGGEPRRLNCDGHDLKGVHILRQHSDALAIIDDLPTARRIVLIGGGYVGLEVASVLIGLGKQVVLVEKQPRLLARVAGQEISAFFEREHRRQGVDVRLETDVVRIEGRGGRATGVWLSTGELIEADMIIAGIGITPSIDVLAAAGADVADGVLVDPFCRTTLPDVFAVGDCAAHQSRFAEGRIRRLESIQNANDQATTVAKVICDQPEPYNSVPCFWSHQYDLRLQTIGLAENHDQIVVRGDIDQRSFSVVYLRGSCVVAIDSVNAPRDFAQGRRLVEQALSIDRQRIADPNVALKDL